MDYVQFITTVGTAVSTIYVIKSSFDKKIEEVKLEINQLREEVKSQRSEISHLSSKISNTEGEMAIIRSMLHALVGSLIGHKTGTEGK